MKKLLILIVLLTGFTSVAASFTITSFPEQTATYAQDNTITLECSGECPVPDAGYGSGTAGMSLNIEGCGFKQSYQFTYDSGNTMSVTYHVPEEYHCGVGEYDMEVLYEGNVRATSTLNIEPKGSVDQNRGDYLYFWVNVKNEECTFSWENDCDEPDATSDDATDVMKGFYLSDSLQSGWDANEGDLLLAQYDGGVLGSGWQKKDYPTGSSNITAPDYGSLNDLIYRDDDTNYFCGGSNGGLDSSSMVCLAYSKQYTSSNNFDFSGVNHASTISPLHNNGNFNPEGEIIAAKGLTPIDPVDFPENNDFFICRGSMDGKTVATEDGENGLYRCDVKGNGVDWRGNEPRSWIKLGGQGECADPVVGIRENNGEKAVFMGSDSGGQYTDDRTGCNYQEIDTTVETGQPDIFICEGSLAKETSETGNDPVTAEKETYCQYNIEQREYPNIPDPQRNCDEGSCELGDQHNFSALAVKYYVPKEAIPVGKYAQSFEGSDFATSNGFNNVRFDHIHQAELDYLDGNGGEVYKDAYTHNQSNYTNINVSTGSAYSRAVDDTDEDAIRQVWNPSNATGQYTGNVRNPVDLSKIENGVNNTEVFNGGFYPDCIPGQQWGYDEDSARWRCTGDIDWSFDVYSIEPSGNQQSDAAGFFVMPWEFTGSNLDPFTSYREARGSNQNDKSEASIEAIRSVCWRGGLDNEPAFSSDNRGDSWFAKKVTGIGDDPQVPVPLMGDLQLGSSDNVYSCRIEFDNSQDQTITAEGNLKVVSSADVAEQQTRAQSILSGSYNSNLRDSWFNISKVCSGGSTCSETGIVPSKNDLSGSLVSTPVMNLQSKWQQNLSYGFNQMSSGDLSSYLREGPSN